MQENGIDFVITWVDGSDLVWQQEKDYYLRSTLETETDAGVPRAGGQRRRAACDNTQEVSDREDANPDVQAAGNREQEDRNTQDAAAWRFRDWGNLKYWFRGVEKCAPWVRKIHFVTWGHLPTWLNTKHPKMHVVRHEDYIPKKYLPTFNSHTIEWNMHKINGLSELFVYFNDDIFLTGPVKESVFFVDGRPCDMLAFQPVVANPKNPVMSHIYLNNALVLSKYFDKRGNVRKQPGNYFKIGYPPLYFFYNILEMAFPLYTGMYTVHGPSAFLKSTYEMLWEREERLLDATCSHRFRHEADISQYLAREWQKLSGNFKAQNITKKFRYFDVKSDNPKLVNTIVRKKADMICINDANEPIDFLKARQQIIDAFEIIFPEKSGFERDDY